MEIDIPDPVITTTSSYSGEGLKEYTAHVLMAGEPVFTRVYTSVYEVYMDIDHPQYAGSYYEAEQKVMRAFAEALKKVLSDD